MARMRANKSKILESILFLIEQGGEEGSYPTQYDIVKSLFGADLFHLQKYGRPVTYDNYSALPFGPVPCESYDMLKPGYNPTELDEAQWPLWDRRRAPDQGPKTYRYCNPKRVFNKRRLSATDLQELKAAYDLVKQLGFEGTRDWTHEHPAYKNAWAQRGSARSHPIDYVDLTEDADAELVSELAEASRFI